ncbi:DUF1801 domain-containing protein [Viridibacillus sp. YIM B01967]|uniref:DUF1801 domain-containing protein n=1 Tax=Viridibacillus soli TaxID=2798301 RepID=A0ABS1HA46_9BACL|nr:DUF1801 domain-containing protein [Viridibacillus soli]
MEEVDENRREAFKKLFETVQDHLPHGFEALMQYNMPNFVVPKSIYPNGYHCSPKDPLPFIGVAAQKNHITLYHMGIYAKPELLDWFVAEYPKHMTTKLNMGKSCIRFSNTKTLPYALIAELVRKMTVQDWIELYEKQLTKA